MRLKLFVVSFCLVMAAWMGYNYFYLKEIAKPTTGGFAIIYLGLAIIGAVIPIKKSP